MKYIKQQITEFLETNLSDIYPEWNENTTYILEEDETNLTSASIVLYEGYYYRSVIRENKGYNPKEYDGIKWVKYKVSNKYAMLDMTSQAKSVKAGDNLTVTFKQNFIKNIAIGNYTAELFTVEILDNQNNVLWDYTSAPTINSGVYDWWTYMYAPYIKDVERAMMLQLPLKGDKVRITFIGAYDGATTSCGFLVGGEAVDMGKTLMGVRFGYQSYSIKEFDSFGSIKIEKRAVQETLDFETVIETKEANILRREVKKVYDEIVVFILDERPDSPYDNLMSFGVIQDISLLMENEVQSTLSFNVIEVI